MHFCSKSPLFLRRAPHRYVIPVFSEAHVTIPGDYDCPKSIYANKVATWPCMTKTSVRRAFSLPIFAVLLSGDHGRSHRPSQLRADLVQVGYLLGAGLISAASHHNGVPAAMWYNRGSRRVKKKPRPRRRFSAVLRDPNPCGQEGT